MFSPSLGLHDNTVVAGDSPFTSDTLSIDGGSEPLFYDDYPQGATDISNLGGDPLLGFDQSVGSGFDVAYATGDCKLGEVVQNVGSVAFSGSCPPEWGSQGCGRTPEYVINCINPSQFFVVIDETSLTSGRS